MDRDEEQEFYARPENRQPQGPPRRRKTQLTEVVPVRLSKAVLEQIREASEAAQQSVSTWIRRAIEAALSPDPTTDGDRDLSSVEPSKAAGVVPLVTNESITVLPAQAVLAQILITARDLVDTIEREVHRVNEGIGRWTLYESFIHRQHIDADSVELRARAFGGYHHVIARDVAQTQEALRRLSLLQSYLRETDIQPAIAELRERVKNAQRLTDQVEREVLDAPKQGWSDLAERGLVNFYHYSDMVRAALQIVDEELYELSHSSED